MFEVYVACSVMQLIIRCGLSSCLMMVTHFLKLSEILIYRIESFSFHLASLTSIPSTCSYGPAKSSTDMNKNKDSSLHLFLDFHGGMTRYCDSHAASERDVRCETDHDWGWAQKGAAWQQPAVLGECTMHFKCLRTSCTCTAAFLGRASSSSCTRLRLPQLSPSDTTVETGIRY